MLMYEIWSLGHKPFESYSNSQVHNWHMHGAKLKLTYTYVTLQVVKAIDTGYCLPPPPGCPRVMYKTMINCWYGNP